MLPIQSSSSESQAAHTTGGILSPLSPEQSASKVHDLPPHLLNAGWRRFWSNSGGREYFYNKFTKASRWDYPDESCDFTDPLRISDVHQQPPAVGRSFSQDGNPVMAGCHPPLKRTNSERTGHPSNSMAPPVKRINLISSPYWDFEISSNALLRQLKPMNHVLLHPHPEVEQFRASLVAKLRQNYQDLCSHREGIDAPPESFNRWLLERRVVDKGCDALLPSECPNPLSQAMFREVMNDIPVRLVRPRRNDDARKMLAKYAEAARSLVEKRGGTSAENRKSVTWHAGETFDFLQKRTGASFDDYMERLAHLKRECQPHVIAAAKSSVESICTKIYSLSCEYARKIREKHISILQQAGADVRNLMESTFASSEDLSSPVALYSPGVPCSPVMLSCPIIPSPIVEHQEANEVVSLRAKIGTPEVLKINLDHFKKLEQLYQLNCRDDPGMVHFLSRVWCLLKRYNTFFGTKENEGFGLQGALPAPVFQCLNRVFGVTFECFASPLNCYFRQYCSAFADTDGYFGSRGPVLDFYPRSGSFEANPPFNEELMEAVVDHFESLLSETSEPLSFIVFIPDWKDPPTEALMRLESSRYKRNQTTIPAMEHEYRHGFQHICQKKDLNVKSVHGTLVVFLQNEEGAKKWPVTSKEIKELIQAYQRTTPSN